VLELFQSTAAGGLLLYALSFVFHRCRSLATSKMVVIISVLGIRLAP
jgi:hypothetical protein